MSRLAAWCAETRHGFPAADRSKAPAVLASYPRQCHRRLRTGSAHPEAREVPVTDDAKDFTPLALIADQSRVRVLVIDDEPAVVRAVVRILERSGIPLVEGVTDPYRAVERFRDMAPDLVLLDLRMPQMDGLKVLEELVAATPPATYLPIVMLTAEDRPEIRERALAMGAKDFLSKPFDRSEVAIRIRNLLDTRALHRALRAKNQELEARVLERTEELAESQREVLDRLSRAGEYRDDETGRHTQRVAEIAVSLAERLGLLRLEVDLIARAAPLHDVGKIGVPDSILLKRGRLTPEEFGIMKRHTIIGATMLCGGHTRLMKLAETIARSHHERWDGTGYPDGIAGQGIPLPARIVGVADFFDAMTHTRQYRPAVPVEATLAEMKEQRGRHFDPALVDAFLSLDQPVISA
jgi:putative two-component system response regulator